MNYRIDEVEEKRCKTCGNQRANGDGIGIWCGKNNMPVHAFNSCGHWFNMYAPVEQVVEELQKKDEQTVEIEEIPGLPPAPSPIVEMPLNLNMKLYNEGVSTFEFNGKTYHSFSIPNQVSITLLDGDTVAPEVVFASFKQWWSKRNAVKQK